MVKAALEDFMMRLLIVCAIFSIGVEVGFNINTPEKLATAWIEGFAILVAVAVVSLVSAWSDYKKEGQFMEQQKLEDKSKTVSGLTNFYQFHFLIFKICLLIYLNLNRSKHSETELKRSSTETTSKLEISSKFKLE